MRLYSFQNFYFAGIHAGIQTAHSVAEIAARYDAGSPENEMFLDWAVNHKTIIVKNGGMAGDLRKLIETLSRDDNPYPWAKFHEDQYAADGCLTNVSIVVPTDVWRLADAKRKSINCTMNIPGCGIYAERDKVMQEYTDLNKTPHTDVGTGVAFGAAAGFTTCVYYYSPYQMYEEQFKRTGGITARDGFELVEFTSFDISLITAMNACGLM